MCKKNCDTCNKNRYDVKSMGRDYNGAPDAPDMCFICRVEYDRGRVYNNVLCRYVDQTYLNDGA